MHNLNHHLAFVLGLAGLIAFGMGVGLLAHVLGGWINRRAARIRQPEAPTDHMVALAQTIARERNLELNPAILASFERTRGFLNAYARDVLPPR